jgi:hypothetical protein
MIGFISDEKASPPCGIDQHAIRDYEFRCKGFDPDNNRDFHRHWLSLRRCTPRGLRVGL